MTTEKKFTISTNRFQNLQYEYLPKDVNTLRTGDADLRF